MLIDLQSIDENGQFYTFNQSSEELEGAFGDLLGNADFQVKLEVRPLGNTFQIMGTVESVYPEVCSRCGYDIQVPLKSRINEILVVEKERPRNTQVSQSRQNFDGMDPAVTYLQLPELDLREFLHEMIAAAFEQYPVCQDRAQCESQKTEIINEETKAVGHPGFAALKNLKLD